MKRIQTSFAMPRPEKPHIVFRGRWLVRDTPPDGIRRTSMLKVNQACRFVRTLNRNR